MDVVPHTLTLKRSATTWSLEDSVLQRYHQNPLISLTALDFRAEFSKTYNDHSMDLVGGQQPT